jgi:hypothetical protein
MTGDSTPTIDSGIFVIETPQGYGSPPRTVTGPFASARDTPWPMVRHGTALGTPQPAVSLAVVFVLSTSTAEARLVTSTLGGAPVREMVGRATPVPDDGAAEVRPQLASISRRRSSSSGDCATALPECEAPKGNERILRVAAGLCAPLAPAGCRRNEALCSPDDPELDRIISAGM